MNKLTKLAKQLLYPPTARCCNCGWVGTEEELYAGKCVVDGGYCHGCPNCKTDHYLADAEDKNDTI
jgi:hypothetical protein